MNRNQSVPHQGLSRRQFLTSAALVSATGLISACVAPTQPGTGASDASGAPAGARPNITVWTSVTFTPDADKVQDDMMQAWCDENNVELELNRFTADARDPVWQTAIEGDNLPDVANLRQEDVAKFILSGVLLESTESIEELNTLEGGYTAGSMVAGRSADGRHWTFPSFNSTEIFYVRKDKVEEAGMALPETWEDVLEVAKAITVPGEFWGWGSQIGTPSWDSEVAFTAKLWGYGGKTWDEESQPAIDSPETRVVLDFMKEAWDAGVIPPDAITGDDAWNNRVYQTGIAGMVFNTGSILRYLQNEDEELLALTEPMLIPAGPAGRFCSGYFYQWGAFNSSAHPDISLDLLEYMMAPDQLRPYYEAGGGNLLPVFNDMRNDAMWQDPQRKILADMLPYTYPQGNPGLNAPWVLDAWIDHTMVKMLNRVIVDRWENDEAVAEADAALWKWYNDWQERL